MLSVLGVVLLAMIGRDLQCSWYHRDGLVSKRGLGGARSVAMVELD